MRLNTRLSGGLSALVVAAAIMAPAAYAGPTAACDPSAVAPPPSSIAASAAKEYSALRACGGGAGEPSPPTGFDWLSATLGATAATGFSLVLAATVGTRRRTGPHAVSHPRL